MLKRFFVYSLCLLMSAPPSVWAAAAPQGAASNPVVPPAAQVQAAAPGSRAELIRVFNESSWQFFSILNHHIPGILIERSTQEQLIFSPFHSCRPEPYTQEELATTSSASLDALLVLVQTTLASYWQAHQAEMDTMVGEDNFTQGERFAPKAIEVRGRVCVPQGEFSQMPAPRGQAWTMKRELKRQKGQVQSSPEQEQQGVAPPTPLFVAIARKAEGTALSESEVRGLKAWVSWLREFRNSLALYEKFHSGKTHLSPPPQFVVSAEVAKKIEWQDSGAKEAAAEAAFRADGNNPPLTGPLTPAMLTANKIYNATESRKRLPHFEPCGAGYCFVDGVRELVEALDEKIILALQSPKLKPGAYLDALVMLAKRTSIIEKGYLNKLLPKALQNNTLPDACRTSPKEISFLGDGFNEYEALLKDFSKRDERAWWIKHVVSGVQELVTAYQLRQKKLNVPPADRREFSVGKERDTLYGFGQEMAKKWLVSFFSTFKSQVSLSYRESAWPAIQARLLKRLDETSFLDSLRLQQGQEFLEDFTSAVGEKLLLLFGSIEDASLEALDRHNYEERKEVLVQLVKKIVASALRDTFERHVFASLEESDFQIPGVKNGQPVTYQVLPLPMERLKLFWKIRMEPAWASFVEREGSKDSELVAKSIVEDLFSMPALQAIVQGIAYNADSKAREAVENDVKTAAPRMEEAARAQETVEYMRSMLAWKGEFFAGFTSRGTYEEAMKGEIPGTESACFYGKDQNGHGHGINTFGALNPLIQEDYDHLKKAVGMIALRSRKSIEKRLSKQFPDAVLRRSIGVADSGTFVTALLEKLDQVREAKDTRDAGRVAVIRRGEFAEFEAWMKDWRNAEKWYTAELERESKELFDNELRPLLRIRSAQRDASAWEVFFEGRLEALFKSHFPMSRTPKVKDFLAHYDKSQMVDGEASAQLAKSMAALAVEINRSKTLTASSKHCLEKPEQCVAWIDSLEKFLAAPALRLIVDVRAAHHGSLKVKSLLVEKSGQFGETERKLILKLGWVMTEMLGERRFTSAAPVAGAKPLWDEALKQKFASATAEEKGRLGAVPTELESLMAGRRGNFKKAQDTLALFLESITALAKEKKDLSPEAIRKAMVTHLNDHPEIYNGWKTEVSDSLSFARHLIQTGVPFAVTEGAAIINTVVGWEIEKISVPEIAGLLDTVASSPFHTEIVKNYLPGFFDFKKEAARLINRATVPQIEVTEEILALEKGIEQSLDAEKLLIKHGKGDSEDAKTVRKQLAEQKEDRRKALDRYDDLRSLQHLLSVVAKRLPQAKRASAAMSEVKAKDDIFATLYQDSKEIATGDLASPAATLSDFNTLSQSILGTYSVSAGTARSYLNSLEGYCKAGRDDASIQPHFEAAYKKVIQANLEGYKKLNPVAAKKLAQLAAIPSAGAKAYWEGVAGRAPEVRAQIAAENRGNILELWSKATAAVSGALKYDISGWMQEMLPTTSDFCSYVESQSRSLLAEIKAAKDEEATSVAWRNRYWTLVDTASVVFHEDESPFAPFIAENGETVWFAGSPSDTTPELDAFTALKALATPALVNFLRQQQSPALLAQVWPQTFLAKLSLAPLNEAQLKAPLTWLNGTSVKQRVVLYLALKEQLVRAVVAGSVISSWLGVWKSSNPELPPDNVAQWFGALESLALVWKQFRPQISGTDSKAGRWPELAQALVLQLAQGTLYRVQGGEDEIHRVAQDAGGKSLAQTRAAVTALWSTKESVKNEKTLIRLADAAADIVLSAKAQAQGDELFGGLPLASLSDAQAVLPPGAAFYADFMRDYSAMPKAGSLGIGALQWAGHYTVRTTSRQSATATGPLVFQDAWEPAGKEGTQAKDFAAWVDLVLESNGEKAFQLLRSTKKDGKHLWNKYETLAQAKADKDGEYQNLVRFFEKWDRNAKATKQEKTYPYFLALLNWNIRHYETDIFIGPNANAQSLYDSFVAHRLALVVEELDLPLDDFEGWRSFLVKKGTASEWAVMAENKLIALVDTAQRRFYSTLIDAPKVENPYTSVEVSVSMQPVPYGPYVPWVRDNKVIPIPVPTAKSSYYYRVHPLVSSKERTQLRPEEKFPEWYARTQDPRYYALHRVTQTNSPQIPLFNQSVADSLEMQGANSLTNPSEPVSKSAFKQGRLDWDAYFAKAAHKAEGISEAVVEEIEKKVPGVSRARIREILVERDLIVAARLAANELLFRHPNEAYMTDMGRSDFAYLQSDLNAMTTAFAKNRKWRGTLPKIELDTWSLAEAHRQGAAKAIYLTSQISFASIFLGKGLEQKTQAEAILSEADAHFRLQAQANTYTRGLLKVSENIDSNLEALCKERGKFIHASTPEEFEKAEESIWKAKLPLMDNLLKIAEEMSPAGSSDEPRRMMQALLRKAEKQKDDEKWWEQRIGLVTGVAFIGVVLAGRSPYLARLAAMSPAAALVGKVGGGILNTGLGIWFGYQILRDIHEDFVVSPGELERMNTVRDSQYAGRDALMTDDSAGLRSPGQKNMLDRQRSTGVWVWRLVNAAISFDMVGTPALKYLYRHRWMLVNGSAKVSAAIRQAVTGGAQLKAVKTAQFLAARELEAAAAVERLGQAAAEYEAVGAQTAETTLASGEMQTVKKTLDAWEADGQLVPSAEMASVLLQDTQRQIKDIARIAEIDPVLLTSNVELANPKLIAYQDKMLPRLRLLRDLEDKLQSAVPHVSAFDLQMLFVNQGSVMAAYRPILLQMAGLPTMNPAIWRLAQLQNVVQSGANAHKALSYHYAVGWMARAKEDLVKLAEKEGMTQAQLLSAIAEEKLFVPGVARTMYGKHADNINALAPEFRQILRLGRLGKGDPELFEALASDNISLVSRYYMKGPRVLLAKPSKGEEAKPVAAPPVARLEPEPLATGPTADSIRTQLVKNAPSSKEKLADLGANESALRSSLQQISFQGVDSAEVVNLVQSYSSETLSNSLGQAIAQGGVSSEGLVPALRMARAYRLELETELNLAGSQALSARQGAEAILRVSGRSNEIVNSGLTLDESLAIFGYKSKYGWTSEMVDLRPLPNWIQRDVAEEATAILKRFDSNRDMWSVSDLMEAAGIPSKRFGSVDLVRQIKSPAIAERLSPEEHRQLVKLLEPPTPLMSNLTAENILRLPSTAAPADISQRADALVESLQGLGLPAENPVIIRAVGSVRRAQSRLLGGAP